MPGWSGTGTFQRVYSWVADAAAGIDIIASRVDQDTDNITTAGFNNVLTRDGQGSATANLPMNSFRHTGASNGVNQQDYVTVAQVQSPGAPAGTPVIAAGAYLGEIRTTSLVEATLGLYMPGWHVCSGTTRPRTDPLWKITGFIDAAHWVFGNGDGTTTYTLPDLRGRAAFGKDDMGGVAANRITGASSIAGTTLGAVGGDQRSMAHNHTLTDPGHGHTNTDPGHTHGTSDPGHTHSESVVAPTGTQGQFGVNANFTQNGAGTTGSSVTGVSVVSAGAGISVDVHSADITLSPFGSGVSENMPPTLITNYVIFVGA